ncbi:serine/threonine protein kinase [Gracilibacillus marinus]|uniref:Serine/threonine protein kinase n=1 Tax=Gracilibacillus marinus TaxID=630535 RepID=A0ABV8VZH9_9BACI
MNTQMLKKPDISFYKGQIITGKWHKKTYHVVRKLGSGAIGTVYLCVCNNVQVALKVSKQSHSITSEVNVLKVLKKVQGHRLGPSLIDVDDYVHRNGYVYSFYVMEYISGEPLSQFVNRHGEEWLYSLLVGFLKDLQALHNEGYIFGDLKMENLIVSRKPARLRWVDVGGTTLVGRSIKEYTEFYDRAYWQAGTRKADPGYDLFALAMVVLRIYYPQGFERGNNPKKTLMQKTSMAIKHTGIRQLINKMLNGEMIEADIVKNELIYYTMKQNRSRTQQVNTKQHTRHDSVVYPMMEVLSILSISGLCYLYVAIFM